MQILIGPLFPAQWSRGTARVCSENSACLTCTQTVNEASQPAADARV